MNIQTQKYPVEKSKAVASAGAQRPANAPQSQVELKPDSALKNAVRSKTGDERRIMICEAAYYLAEHRGFEAGHEIEDWLVAESQIDAVLAQGQLPVKKA
jgi:Protein of unknown function (DUF2934)